jgi:MOSC domain-containing protein YiiM
LVPPCWKLNDRCEEPDMALRLQMTMHTGWYFRVIEEGEIGAGDDILLIERPHPDFSLARILWAQCTEAFLIRKSWSH